MLMNQSSTPSSYRAEALHLSKGEKITVLIEGSAIIFVEKGKITPFFDGWMQRALPEGQLFFLPRGILCALASSSCESSVILLEIPDIAILCHRFFPDTVFKKSSSPDSLFHPLETNEYVRHWLETMRGYMEDKRMDHLIVEIKTLELFHFLKTSYPMESLASFFSPVDENDYHFVLFVLQNYTSVRNMEELACLSSYSLSGFEKQFRRVFGIAPYKWMLKQKNGEHLQRDLRDLKAT